MEFPRSLLFRRRPGELARSRVDLGAFRRVWAQDERQLVVRIVRIAGGNDKLKQVKLLDRLIDNRIDHRRPIDLVDCNLERSRAGQGGCPFIGCSNGDRVAIRAVRFQRCPGEESADRINRGPSRRARIQRKRHRAHRVVRIGGACRERQSLAFVDGGIRDLRHDRRKVGTYSRRNLHKLGGHVLLGRSLRVARPDDCQNVAVAGGRGPQLIARAVVQQKPVSQGCSGLIVMPGANLNGVGTA